MPDRVFVSYPPGNRRGIDVTEPTEVFRQTSNPDGTGQRTENLKLRKPRVRVTEESIIIDTATQRITAQHDRESDPGRGYVSGNVTNVTALPVAQWRRLVSPR